MPRPGSPTDLPPAAGSADALVITQLMPEGAPLVVIASTPLDAQRLQEEAKWFAPQLRVHFLPDWETLPYDAFSPHQDLVSERLATLYAVMRGECDLLVVAAGTALTRLASAQYLAAHTFFLKKGSRLDIEGLRAQLVTAGYEHVTQVVAPGEYSIRGGLVDLYPTGAALPFRIDLFDDEVDSIKNFDADSQRTLFPVSEIRMLPAREFPMDEKGRTTFRRRFRETFEGDPTRTQIYKDISNGTPTAGIEYYLPLFFDETATLFDYLPEGSRVLLHHNVPGALAEFWVDLKSRYSMVGGDRSRPVLPPGDIFLSDEQFFVALQKLPVWRIKAADKQDEVEREIIPPVALAPMSIATDRRAEDP
ncbi:MAG: transcription-repair coupling factor, partial [Rhodocyclaceae bacterium]|nr:transcription-repair coupling factor [Rhodocyclaceae bacterium]